MNLEAYIESGILELYVLNVLEETERSEVLGMLRRYPQLRQEMEKIEYTLERYAQATAIVPPETAKRKIKATLDHAVKEQAMGIHDMVLIGEDSDYKNWLRLINEHFPLAFQQDNFCEVLREKDGVKQVLVVSSFDIPDETHEDVHESFLILQGQCKCTVGPDVFYLEAGGYTQIPLHEHHQVEIVRAPVMAVVQYNSVL